MNPWGCEQLRVTEETKPMFFCGCMFIKAFSDEEIETIQAIVNDYPEQQAQIGEGQDASYMRVSQVRWLNNNDPRLEWVFSRLKDMIAHANGSLRWNFEIDGFFEPLQHARYGEGGHFDYHCDICTDHVQISRKVSVSVQLTDPAEYEGGDLELYSVGPVPKEKGTVVVFPSFLMHRVTPVTRGVRESLICWVSGPPLR